MNARHTPHRSSSSAFTLIELLTVITIIAILMGLLFSALNGAKNQARRATASAAVRNIVMACKNYQNDYGKFPAVETAKDNTYYSFGDVSSGKCKLTNNELFDILRAIDRGVNAAHVMNRRQQKYFEGGKARGGSTPRDGFCDGSDSGFSGKQGQFLDPWGAQYCVVLDATGNDEIDMGAFFTDLAGKVNVIRVSAAAFSMGLDSARGGKGYVGQYQKPSSSEPPDDIVSWR